MWRLQFKILIIMFIATMLQSCATIGVNSSGDFLSKPNEESGYLVASIGIKTGGASRIPPGIETLFFRKIGSQGSAKLGTDQDSFIPGSAEIQVEDKKANVVFLKLAPGEYEFYKVSFYFNNGYFERTIDSKQDFLVPFVIKSNEVFYAGEFIANATWGKSLIGIPVVSAGYFEHASMPDRDLNILRTTHPEFSNIPVDADNSKIIFLPFIQENNVSK